MPAIENHLRGVSLRDPGRHLTNDGLRPRSLRSLGRSRAFHQVRLIAHHDPNRSDAAAVEARLQRSE
jgi:hypothetical protein